MSAEEVPAILQTVQRPPQTQVVVDPSKLPDVRRDPTTLGAGGVPRPVPTTSDEDSGNWRQAIKRAPLPPPTGEKTRPGKGQK